MHQYDIFDQIEKEKIREKPYFNAHGEPLPWEGKVNMLTAIRKMQIRKDMLKNNIHPKTKEDWEKLVHKFEMLLEEYPDNDKVDDWMDKLDFCYEHLGRLSNEDLADQAERILRIFK